MADDFAEWNPFREAEDGAGALDPSLGEDWDPFEDPSMLELTGEIAMQSGDVEAIEAWIEQAVAAKLDDQLVQPKRDRVSDLRLKAEDEKRRKVAKTKLDKALQGGDRASLREAIGDAAKAGVAHPRELDAAAERLAEMRKADAEAARRKDLEETARREKENEVVAELAAEKLRKAKLVPSSDVQLSEQEIAALERKRYKDHVESTQQQQQQRRRSAAQAAEAPPRAPLTELLVAFPSGQTEAVQADLAATGAALLTRLLPLREKHPLLGRVGLFTPSGQLLDCMRPLHAQGVCQGACLRWDQMEDAPQHDQAPEERLLRMEDSWVFVYWAISCMKPSFQFMRESLLRHSQVVVLGWNATGDKAVMRLSQEVSRMLKGSIFVATGESPPTEGSLTAWDKSVQCSFLRLHPHEESAALGRAVRECLQEAGAADSHVLVVACRTFYSRRVVTAVHQFGSPEVPLADGSPAVTIVPYCVEPQFVYRIDCLNHSADVLVEARQMAELEPSMLDGEVTVSLERLLQAYPVPHRRGWNGGVPELRPDSIGGDEQRHRPRLVSNWPWPPRPSPSDAAERAEAPGAEVPRRAAAGNFFPWRKEQVEGKRAEE